MIRLGFIGLGGMGQCAHLRNYIIQPDVRIVAAAELRPKLAAEVAHRYGIERLYPSHAELLASEPELDGLVAIQPYHVHGQLLPQILQRGLPTLIEKPLGSSVEAGERVLEACRSAGARLYVAYHKRSDPATLYVRRLIDQWQQSGAFGRMTYVRITMPPGDWIAQGFCSLIRSDEPYPAVAKDPLPPGMDPVTYRRYDAFVNYYIHQVNLMRHLLGEPYSVRYADPTGVLMAVQSQSGIPGALEMGTHRNTLDWQEAAWITFERGWIRLELPAPLAIDRAGRVTVYEDAGDGAEPRTMQPQMPHIHAMRQQANHFVQELRGESTSLCRAEEAIDDLRIARTYIQMLLNR